MTPISRHKFQSTFSCDFGSRSPDQIPHNRLYLLQYRSHQQSSTAGPRAEADGGADGSTSRWYQSARANSGTTLLSYSAERWYKGESFVWWCACGGWGDWGLYCLNSKHMPSCLTPGQHICKGTIYVLVCLHLFFGGVE